MAKARGFDYGVLCLLMRSSERRLAKGSWLASMMTAASTKLAADARRAALFSIARAGIAIKRGHRRAGLLKKQMCCFKWDYRQGRCKQRLGP
jgi:hypothetical protein